MEEVRSGTAGAAQGREAAVTTEGEATDGSFWAPIRGRLISIRQLSVPLRVLLVGVVALVVAGAVALGVQRLPQPLIAVTVDQQQQAVQLPVSLFALTAITSPFAWALLLTGFLLGAGSLATKPA